MAFRMDQKKLSGQLPQILFRWLRQLIFDDWGMKLLALAITIGLWYGVTGQREPATIRLRNVNLRFLLPADMEISNTPIDQVEVILDGSKQALGVINVHNPVASVDVNDYKSGERILKLTPDRITMELPDGVSIEGIEPSMIPLQIERRVEREIEIEPQFEGNLPEGFEMISSQTAPSKVRIRGPESHVNSLSKVSTEKVSLSGRTSNFDVLQAAVEIPNQKVVALDTSVTIHVKIGEERIEKHFTGVYIKNSQTSNEFSLSTNMTATLYGPRSILEKLKTEDVKIIFPDNSNEAIDKSQYQLILPPEAEGKIEIRSVNFKK
jgi:YbbR domain-containing protein